jgi:eukaryotic-like serine/threonine-protein kinase
MPCSPAAVLTVMVSYAGLDATDVTEVNKNLPATEPAPPDSERDVVPESSRLPERYLVVGKIASGSFGEVRRVHDTVLDRELAMKLLRWEYIDDPRVRARFLAEAQITAKLQHPGIVAVHDRGELEDRRLWYTMKVVDGRTLGAVIREVHAASGPEGFRATASGWTFRRLIDAFARVSQAVGYAHSCQVMHRDLKPENIMTGTFGEVLVMDWGLARHVNEPGEGPASGRDSISIPPPPPSAPARYSPPASPGATTRILPETKYGEVIGTPAYMSPEQARGLRDLHGPPSDVYALGAILYHLLTGRAPYDGDSNMVWHRVLAGPPRSISEASQGGPPLPLALVAIAERAMQRAIEDRYPDAEKLAQEVLTWLDEDLRRERALAVLTEARALEPHIAELRARAAAAQAEAEALLARVRPSDPIDRKRPGWHLQSEAARLTREAAFCEAEWQGTVRGALSQDPDLPEAHAALADYYRERLKVAELAHEDEYAAGLEVLLRAHDRGRHAAFLRGEASLTLLTDPPGAEVVLERYVALDHRLVPETVGVLGQTPLHAVALTRGRYRLRIKAEGRAETHYPILLERGSHWDGCAPGEAEPRPIELPREGELGPDDVYVPAGYCYIGGDPLATDSLPRQRVWIDGFVIRRFPVTNAEYLVFLNDLVDSGRAAEATEHCPLLAAGSEHLMFGRGASGRFEPRFEGPNPQWLPDLPVVLVDWHAAARYARWLAEKTGEAWRLPNELEREKAARGSDGRIFPWGDETEVTFACVIESFARNPQQVSVLGYPHDESPYGVRGLAGNMRDWCLNVWRRDGPPVQRGCLCLDAAVPNDPDFRSVKGGAWGSSMGFSRAATRFGTPPGNRHLMIGLRLVRSYRARE